MTQVGEYYYISQEVRWNGICLLNENFYHWKFKYLSQGGKLGLLIFKLTSWCSQYLLSKLKLWTIVRGQKYCVVLCVHHRCRHLGTSAWCPHLSCLFGSKGKGVWFAQLWTLFATSNTKSSPKYWSISKTKHYHDRRKEMIFISWLAPS